MIVIRVQAQDNNANGYLVCLFQVVSRLKYFFKNSQVMFRSTHKWYPISGTHGDSKCSRNGFLSKNTTSGSKLEDSFKWYSLHTSSITSIYGVNHARRWFHKWSSTLSDHKMKNASLTYKSSRVSNGWPMLSHRGRCHTNWYQENILCVVFQEALHKIQVIQVTSSIIPTIMKMSIKNARFKPQPSTPNVYLCINEKHTFYGNWWQRGRDYTKIGKPL